ncbi:MAG: CRTAC1 family protein [Bacteroidota bacterium]
MAKRDFRKMRIRELQKIGLFFLLGMGIMCTSYSQMIFTEITEEAGIHHQFRVYEGMFGGGICVFDLNEDGYDDLYITSGINEDVLYLNQGNGTFKNIYEGSGLEITKGYVTQGVSGADVNRDGWVDLFITTITTKDSTKKIPRAKNLLFLNNGDMTFADATSSFKLDKLNSFSTGANFGDFNADGYPDLFVGNYFKNYEGDLTYINDQTIVSANQVSKGYLLENRNGKSFKNVYVDYGLDFKGYGFGGVFHDFDNDGDQDLMVNHDFGYKATPNVMLENLYPEKKFKDVAEELEMDLAINSMGTAMGDINEDGYMDYLFPDIRFNEFMVSQGKGKPYKEMLTESGMDVLTISWGANFADFDHDGDLDLFVANGDLNPNDQPMGDFLFLNDGTGHFTDIASKAGIQDFGIGRGSVVFDIENDGDLDVLVVNQAPVLPYAPSTVTRLYRNDSPSGNWLKVKLKGNKSETHGLGSRVEIVVNGKRMMRDIDGGGSSHLSQNATYAHFGLGEATKVDSIIVKWTSTTPQVLVDQPVNQMVVVEQEEAFVESGGANYWLWVVLAIVSVGALIFFRMMKK